jgi:hypothetical protein
VEKGGRIVFFRHAMRMKSSAISTRNNQSIDAACA